MPSSGLLDWIGGPPRQNSSSFFTQAVPPRSYGMTAADAVMQGRDALGDFRDAATYADLQRQQTLAPLQFEVDQQKLQGQADLQPKVFAARDGSMSAFTNLDPTKDSYLQERRAAIMQNPYGLADPIVQEVLRSNDRAYDDYMQSRRLEASLSPRQLTPLQQASIQQSITRTTKDMLDAKAMGDEAMVEQYAKQLQILNNIIGSQSTSGAPGDSVEVPDAPSPGAPSPEAPPTAQALGEEKFMTDSDLWQSYKERIVEAILKEAEKSDRSAAEVLTEISKGDVTSNDFFTRNFGSRFEGKAFTTKKDRWGSDDVSWSEVLLALQGDTNLLYKMKTSPSKRAGNPPAPRRELEDPILDTPGKGWGFTQVK
jgi:hypothetical protein